MPDLPDLTSSSDDARSIACDALIVGTFTSGEGFEIDDSALDPEIASDVAQHLRNSRFKAKPGDVVEIPLLGRSAASSLVVAGLGPRDKLERATLMRASASAARRLGRVSTVVAALPPAGDNSARAVAEGLSLGSYRFTTYKKDANDSAPRRFIIPGASESELDRARAAVEATWIARDLSNEPASTLTPKVLAERAVEVGEANGLESEVWDEARLAEHGFGGLLGVAQGSRRPPRFIQLRYAPSGASKRVALIGKGITYDSGGLSLKDASSMETMKTDMSGAAAVIGAMSAIGKLQPNIEVLGFIPTTENMPGGNAIKPGDVIRHYGGKTVEVLNTDAEGRLVLADALAYASEKQPQAIVDVATLTGSMMVALGKKVTGFFANDEGLAGEIAAASDDAGERFWRLPLIAEYRKELDSEIAEMKNVGIRWGGAIIAALFLKEFVGDGIAWAHLDIAGPARADSDYDEMTKGSTGVAARTLISWVEARAT
ncbi:MAG: leucyl aminopeptidase [Actinomycetota bacterium]|nr:leucyl aminopeptidase [Actinomycetota bacterium]